MAVIGTATASLLLINTVPVFGQMELDLSTGNEPKSSTEVEQDSSYTYQIAPNCLRTDLDDSGYTDHLRVTNECKSRQRVKVVLAYARDSSCVSIPRGYYVDFSWNYPGRFDRLESC